MMGCKKHSDWLRIQPIRGAVNQQREELEITFWPKKKKVLGNYAMRIMMKRFGVINTHVTGLYETH